MTVGDPNLWSDVFPEELVPRILDLVWETWKTFEKPAPDEHEVPITRRFKNDLKQAKDFRRLPVRIEREPAEDDPATGEELGRIDLKFNPAGSAREEVYFAFECKRLYAAIEGTVRAFTAEYVSEGMSRFVTGQYSARIHHGGMIGYVLNGETDQAKKQIEKNVRNQWQKLRMTNPASLGESSLKADIDDIRETVHVLDDGRAFRLHHVFLACWVPRTPPDAPFPSTRQATGKGRLGRGSESRPQ
jgi:hypothetical protein